MVMEKGGCKLAIPFHVAQRGAKEIGLDAFFWDSVEAPWRRSLLVFPLNALSSTPSGFEVDVRVSFGQQIRDVKAFLEIEGFRGEKNVAWRVFGMRIAGLILPGHGVYDRIARRLLSPERGGWEIAKDIARLVAESTLLGRMAWANIVVLEKFDKLFIAHNGSIVEKNYNYLASIDSGFRRRLKNILQACMKAAKA